MRGVVVAGLSVFLLCHALLAQESGVLGYWKEMGGSVIHIGACGNSLCATLVQISPTAPAREDRKNPDPNLQRRALCGLRIGEGFRLSSPNRAESGTLYDPKSGNTYHGTMESKGDELKLRGYVGLSIFGRTEKWRRVRGVKACVN